MSSTPRGAAANYDTLSTNEIAELPVREWAAEDSLLALWVPNSMLMEGLRVMAAWGYLHKQTYTWVKTTVNGKLAFGMGRQFRLCSETALIGTRGRMQPSSRSERNAILSPALPHSRKPEYFQDSLERLYPDGPYLELFARRERPRWSTWGLESPSTMGWDLRNGRPDAVRQEVA